MAKTRDTFNEIHITPLTDIFLVLLIIMMVIAPMLDQQGLNLTVPENVAEEQVKKDTDTKIMTVMVDDSDNFYIDDELVDANDLENTIKSKASEYPDGLLIKADSDSSHGAMVKVMDSARNSGITSISVDEI